MVKNPRNLLWLLPLVLFVTSPLWYPGVSSFLRPRGGFDASVVSLEDDATTQRFVMDTVNITMSSWGRIEWVVNAERAFTSNSDQEIGMVEVDAVYTDENKDKTHITSSRGMYSVNDGHLILIDDVVIQKPASRQEMFTDLLHYYNARKMVICPGEVELHGPDFTITAGRLDYDLANDGYDFGGRVKVELFPRDNS